MMTATPPDRSPAGSSGRTPRHRIAISIAPERPDAADQGPRTAEPVTFGIPLPRGLCRDAACLALTGADGAERPVQVQPLEHWADGSIKWALVDAQVTTSGDGRANYTMIAGGAPATHVSGPRLEISATAAGVSIDTGMLQLTLGPQQRLPFTIAAEDDRARRFEAVIDRVDVETSGALRAVVRCEMHLSGSDARLPLQVIARLHVFAGSGTVRLVLTIRNPQPASHPGGIWTLGSGGAVLLRDLAVTIATPAATPGATSAGTHTWLRCSPEPGASMDTLTAPFELYQESSGGERWDAATHKNRDGVVPHRMRGYRLVSGVDQRGGLRASPIVSAGAGPQAVTVAVRQFWENFPQAIEAGGGAITCRLFPRQYPDVHELQGGEQKTHAIVVSFDHDRVSDPPLAWTRNPLLARADPAWCCASGALPYLVPLRDDPHPAYAALGNAAADGDESFVRKREVVDEYGWRHFGDVYADHEAVFAGAAPLFVSHYNNQYDAIAGFGYRFLRSGDARWRTLMDDLAAHVADIDVYHTDGDKAAYNHGLFWHTFHYVDADTCGHRSYPRHPKVGGGGPSAEHNYSAGLLLHYLLTGDPLSRETVIGLARWVVAMDDGTRTIFRWLDRGATGVASASGTPLYHGPGRGAANSIAVLLDGHRLTGDASLLAKAEELIRRCIHPDDDLEALTLLDAERRWYYTVFLQSLGKYLDYTAALGHRGGMYAYARASLLHYAAWMADHEYPYLDKPEILEYPTETWAAQDIRKSDVFTFAARHADPGFRARFLERAAFFFHTSVSTLASKPTRTTARPVVLMLTNGMMYGWSRSAGDISMPAPAGAPAAFAPRRPFVPQKVRAMRRLKALAAAALVTGAAAVGLLIYFLV